jgi:RHS repeat-associated protein
LHINIVYDYLGRRISKSDGVNIRYYVYSPKGLLLAELDELGQSVIEYVYLNGQRLAVMLPSINDEFAQSTEPDWEVAILDEFYLVSTNSNLKLSASDSAQASLSTLTEADNQSDRDIFVAEPASAGFFYLRNKESGLYFRPVSNSENAVLEQRPTNYRGSRTQWKIETLDDGTIALRNKWTNKYLSSGAGIVGEDASITSDQSDYSASWKIVPSNLLDDNAPKLFYVHTNQVGAPLALSDDNGDIAWQATYTPFGKATIVTNNLPKHFTARFPGQYADAETGFYYNYFRDYDPELGRYIQSDPIGLDGGINTYAYVHGNPIMYYDPYGLWAWGDPLPQWMVDGASGWGGVLSFGLTNQINNAQGTSHTYSQCSAAYKGGQALGMFNSLALGGATASRSAVKGWANYSHAALHNRYLKQFKNPAAKWLNKRGNLLNGEYISWQLHARVDLFAYRMLSQANRQLAGAPFSPLRQAINRVPYLPGSAAYGLGGVAASSGSNCGCP